MAGEDGRKKKKKQNVAADAADAVAAAAGGRWEGLAPEVLALILVRLPADVVVRTVPFVCRAWNEVVVGPYCWSEIDIEQWCRRVNRSDVIDAAVRRLVRRSRRTLHRLSAYKIGNSGFAFLAANSGGNLKVLQIPVSNITDQMVEKHAFSLTKLMVLDLSYCIGITPKGIEALGKSCRFLVHFKRNLPPPEIDFGAQDVVSKADDGEALAVANTMPRLQHLELAYGRFSDYGLNSIVSNCRDLGILDIRGCWNVKLEGDLEKQCSLMNFTGPWDDDYDYPSSSEDGEIDGENAVLVDVDVDDSDWSDLD